MKNIFRAEMYKIGKSLTIKVITVILIIYSILSTMFFTILSKISDSLDIANGYSAIGNFFSDSTMILFISIFIIVFQVSDFETKTINNMITRNTYRKDIFLGKYISTMSVCTIIIFCIYIFYVSLSTIINGFGSTQITVIELIYISLIQLTTVFARLSITFLIAMSCRRIMPALIIYFIISKLLDFITMLPNMLMMSGEDNIILQVFNFKYLFANIIAQSPEGISLKSFLLTIIINLIITISMVFITLKRFEKIDIY